MLRKGFLLSLICGLVRSSGIGVPSLAPAAPVESLAPVVTAASSQYFQRTFNRLVAPPVVAPVNPIVHPSVAPVPIAPVPTVFVDASQPAPAPNPTSPQDIPPNIAIAIATAHAAAPVATFLLPPYPFGFPPNIGVLSEQPINVPDESTKEPTTQRSTVPDTTTTQKPEATTSIDTSNSDNSFVQALPSNNNLNLATYGPPPQNSIPQLPQRPQPQYPIPQNKPQQPNTQFQGNQAHAVAVAQSQYQSQQEQFPPYPPQQQQPSPQFNPKPIPQYRPQQQPQQKPQQGWHQQRVKPIKLKTSVEVVPVPLAYITPPPLHKTHAHVKIVKHIYSYVPASSAKIILKPVKIRPVRLVKHKIVRSSNLRANARDIEVTTFNPFPRPNNKPPRAL